MEFLGALDTWVRIYRNPGDELKLGDARLDKILYQFYAPSPSAKSKLPKLLSVGLYFKGEKNFDILETICRVKFGEPTNEGFNELGWAGLVSTLVLIYDLADEEGFMILGSSSLFKQYEEQKEKQQVESAEKDW